jgi:hypothetical protein
MPFRSGSLFVSIRLIARPLSIRSVPLKVMPRVCGTSLIRPLSTRLWRRSKSVGP